jgi:transposase
MRTGRPIPPLKITAAEREELERWARGHDRRLAARASAILACASGASNKDVASRCDMTKQTVGKWRARFQTQRLAGLHDEPRPGAPRRITDQQVQEVIRLAGERAPNGAPWTTRSMAQRAGLTQTAISRIWRTHGIRASGNGAGNGDGHAVPTAVPISPPSAKLEGAGVAHARTLAIQNLLRDARALRSIPSAELDPLLALAVDAIERAFQKHREPGRAGITRAETALRDARNLLDQARAAARNAEQLADRVAATRASVAATRASVAAMRGMAQGMGGRPNVPAPRRCPSCGLPYTLRFAVRGTGGEIVSARMPCPRPRCGKPIAVELPKDAVGVRLEAATG